MGAGAFALPWAFARGGVVLTPFVLVFSGVISLYTLSVLVRTQNLAVAENVATSEEVGSYAGVAKASLGGLGDKICRVMNGVTCFGICCAYLVFIANTLESTPMFKGWASKTLIYAITPVMVALSWLRELGGVSLISAFGNFTVVLGMSFVTWYASALITPASVGALPVSNLGAFSAFFGPVAFLFFTHFSMPGIRGGMAEPDRFFSAAFVGFAMCTVVSIAFGAYCAVAFGPSVASVVVAMLEGNAVATIVKLLLCANLLSTFPIVARSGFLILEDLAHAHTNPEAMKAGKELPAPMALTLRSMSVVLAALCAASVPNFGAVIGIVGGFCCSVLTLVLPPVMLYFLRAKVGAKQGSEAVLLWIVFALGVAASVCSVVFA